MTDETGMKKLPGFKKIPGVPTLKTYPIEGMERGIKIGGTVGFLLGGGLWLYWIYWTNYHLMPLRYGSLFAGGCAAAGAFLGFLLGALWDKLRGKWDS